MAFSTTLRIGAYNRPNPQHGGTITVSAENNVTDYNGGNSIILNSGSTFVFEQGTNDHITVNGENNVVHLSPDDGATVTVRATMGGNVINAGTGQTITVAFSGTSNLLIRPTKLSYERDHG